jgi:NodT family efflux transporter outer membrane factor (OMF) lipoprotein
MRATPAVLAAAAAMLAACSVGPDYKKPDAIVPAGFKEMAKFVPAGWKLGEPRAAIDRGAWWSVYNDPVLDGLERQVEVSNQTLKQSAAAYEQARAVVQEAQAGLYPTATVTPGATRQSSGAGSSSSGGSGSFGGRTRTTYSVEGTASWDPDIWGKIRRTVEGDVAAAQVSAADLSAAELSAQATLAIDYFELRAADQLRTLLDDTVAQYKRSLQLTQNQYDVGVAAKSDVITAQAQLLSAQAAAVNAGLTRATLEHAIAVLTGRAPSDLTIAPTGLPSAIPVVPVAVPSALLERRPDIAAAERAMQQQNAQIGVAVAAFYPSVSLSALYGYSGNPLGSLISASNRLWSLGASAAEIVFDGGLRSATVAAARASYDGAVANYRQVVLTAFQGVEDQLSSLRILQDQAAIQAEAVKSAQRAVDIALNEYQAGTQAYTTVVTAQAVLLQDQETALTIQQNRLVASVTLIEDLGGGWDARDLPDTKTVQSDK